MKLILAALLAVAASTAAVPASAQTYSKCQTLQGNIIIVAGTTCPTGTFWVGYY